MPLLIEDFRRQVVWCSTYCSSTVLHRLELCSQTKVSNLELHRLIDEKVTWEEQQNWGLLHLHLFEFHSRYMFYQFMHSLGTQPINFGIAAAIFELQVGFIISIL